VESAGSLEPAGGAAMQRSLVVDDDPPFPCPSGWHWNAADTGTRRSRNRFGRWWRGRSIGAGRCRLGCDDRRYRHAADARLQIRARVSSACATR